MPAFWMSQLQRQEMFGAVVASGILTQVNTNASNNVKGTYTQLAAATSFDAQGVILHAQTNINGMSGLFDIAIGGAGSEQIIAADILCQGPRAAYAYYLPIYIPKGVRVAARAQSSNANALFMGIHLLAANYATPYGSRVTQYGATSGSSSGTTIDPGGSSGTKGSWTQLVASTTRMHRGFCMVFGGRNNLANSTQNWFFDIGIGGSGSEQIIINNYFVRVEAGAYPITHPVSPWLPIQIPEGVRVAVRSACSGTDATDRLIDVQMIGVD